MSGFDHFRDQLKRHSEALETELDRREAVQEAARRCALVLRVTEGQLMRMAFDALGDRATQLDWSRIEIIEFEPERSPIKSSRSHVKPARRRQDAARPDPLDVRASTNSEEAALAMLRTTVGGGKRWEPLDGLAKVNPMVDPQRIVSVLPRRATIPRLSLRRLDRRRAMHQLEVFALWARTVRFRVVRVVTGKGIHSVGAPVIRPAVVQWVESHRSVVRWAPEVECGGEEFGSMLVELRAPGRRAAR